MTSWRVRIEDLRHGRRDVVVEADPETPASDLARALESAGFTAAQASVNGVNLAEGRTLVDLELAHGDTIWCGTAPTRPVNRQPGLFAVVVGGPSAGRFVRLTKEPLVVGRGAEAALALSDRLVGRRHCEITLTSDGRSATVADLGSSNGTVVDGEVIQARTGIGPGSYLQVGATVITLELVGPEDLPQLATVSGASRPFARRFREARAPLPERLREPAREDDDEAPFRPSWWRPLVPLVGAVGMAVITKHPEFLAIMALGPLVMLFEARRSRKDQDRRHQRQLARSSGRRGEFRARLVATLVEEQARRRALVPPVGAGVVHGTLRTRRVWERSPNDADFGAVAVGLAHLPTEVPIEWASEAPTPHLWWVPLVVPLLETGSIAVLGPVERAQAVVRGMVLSLATAHSPAELRVWVLTDEARAGAWGFARWLPHAFLDEHGSRLATSADDRATLIKLLTQTLDTRVEEAGAGNRARPLPLDVVILDERSVAGSPEVAELLTRGPEHGIVGIALDTDVVPEGVHGTVRLDEFADQATFESRHQPRVESVLVAEVEVEVAEEAARALAGLRPAAGEAGTPEAAEVRLLDLLGLPDLSVSTILDHWTPGAPTTRSTIGLASGTPMVVDLVRDGPHGIVGGTTRSGKTEFLKTLFAGLCLANSPDDLSILIVDFKGGVDHKQSAELPHVVSLTTNADSDTFTRTIELLVAEQNRRQARFVEAGAPNLDSYNAVRERQPDLPPIPRLLVVVDEFGELLSTDLGREHMRTLESVTRIGGGLGLHLLLVTQTFENQLPAQIASNTGMRVCFRVQTPSDSKLVLESGAAATIPASRPGRAVSRFQRGDLVEFQCARVAGRRKDLSTGRSPARVLEVPLGALVAAGGSRQAPDVPADESDFAAIIEALRAAAAASGWRSHAIPWPGPLPRAVPLDELLPLAPAGSGTVVGLADLPDEQVQRPAVLAPADEQVIFFGGPHSGVGDGLVMAATARCLTAGPDQLHLYAIDLSSGVLGPLAALPHTGGVAVRNEAHALKILRLLLELAARRRARCESQGVSTIADLALRGEQVPTVQLVVHGTERMLTQPDQPMSPLLPALLRLLSESHGLGIHVWFSGTSAVGHTRLGATVARRFVGPLPDTDEYAGLGVPRSMMADLDGAGRTYDVQREQLVQLAELTDPTVPAGDVVRSLGQRLAEVHASVERSRLPVPVVEVSWPLAIDRVEVRALRPPRGYEQPVPVGIALGTGEFAWLDAREDGPVVGIVGGARSGRSSALLAIARLGRELGWSPVGIAPSRRSPLWSAADELDAVLPVDGAPVELTPTRPTLVLVDDAHRIEMDDLGLGPALECGHPVLVVLAGSADFLSSRTSFLRTLPKLRAGLVLAPSNRGDGRAFGAQQLSDIAVAEGRAGRGLLVVGGEPTELQLPFDDRWT